MKDNKEKIEKLKKEIKKLELENCPEMLPEVQSPNWKDPMTDVRYTKLKLRCRSYIKNFLLPEPHDPEDEFWIFEDAMRFFYGDEIIEWIREEQIKELEREDA